MATDSRSPFPRPRSIWFRLFCVGTALLISVADLVYWWMATNRNGLGPVLPMPPTTAISFLLLTVAFFAVVLFPKARWPKAALVPLSFLATAMVATAVQFHMTLGFPDWESVFDPAGLTFLGTMAGHSRVQDAILVAATAFNLSTKLLALPGSGRWKIGMVGAVGCALLGFLTLVADTAGNPIFSGAGLLGVTPPAALVFLLLNAGLALSGDVARQFRAWSLGDKAAAAAPSSLREGRLALQFFAVLGCIAIVAVTYLRIQTRAQREQVGDELTADVGLKTAQVVKWRQEREGDATTVWSAPWYREITSALVSTGLTPKQHTEMVGVAGTFLRSYGYRRETIFDPEMKPVYWLPDEPDLTPAPLQRVLKGSVADRLIETPVYVDRSGTLLWGYLVRIRRRYSEETGAYVLFQKELRELFPYLQAWPKYSATGQSILWLRKDKQMCSLGGLRDLPDSPAAIRQPFGLVYSLEDPQSPSSRIANGETKMIEGLTPRGIPALVAGRLIPKSDWLITSSVRSTEVYAPLRRTSWMVVGFSTVVLGLVGFVTTRFWRAQQQQLINERLLADLERKRSVARLGMVMHEARDIILIVDQSLQVIDANRAAAQAFGWSRDELLTKSIQDLRAPETLADLPGIVSRTRVAGGSFFETIYRRRDGSTFPAEASVRHVMVDGRAQSLAIIRDITERRRAEAELRASEERYRLIAENTSDVIWLYDFSQEGFIYVSAAASSMLGYAPGELLGRNLMTTLTEASAAKADGVLRQLLADVRPGAATRHTIVELDQRRKDGNIVPTEVVASVVPGLAGGPGHILGITRDITERKRAREAREKFNTELEQRVEERTGEIQALLDAIPDTVLLCNEQGAVVLARSINYPGVSGLVAGETSAGTRPELDAAIREIIRDMQPRALREKQTVVQEYETAVEAGRLVWIEARVAPMDHGRVLVLLREISARKRLELGVQENLARERQLSEMKSQFVSVASHEFRTPLAAAVGTLELLERHASKLTEAKRVELVARIHRSLDRLTEIMNDVLQLSRADSGRIKATRMNVDLVQLAKDIVREVESGDGEKHRFVFESDGQSGPVPVDTKLTNHILSNLVGNAVRYSPAGTTVTVKLTIGAAAFTFLVIDEGIGIPEAERDHIFEPFARGSNVGQISGTGLGLNIVKRYTELMGGTVELLPVARGTTFKVHIPLTQTAAP